MADEFQLSNLTNIHPIIPEIPYTYEYKNIANFSQVFHDERDHKTVVLQLSRVVYQV